MSIFLVVAITLLVIAAVPEDGRYTPLWRTVGVLALGFVGWHFFDLWGILLVAGLGLVKKI